MQKVQLQYKDRELGDHAWLCVARLNVPRAPPQATRPVRRNKAGKRRPKSKAPPPEPAKTPLITMTAPLSPQAVHLVASHLLRVEHEVSWSKKTKNQKRVVVFYKYMLGSVRYSSRYHLVTTKLLYAYQINCLPSHLVEYTRSLAAGHSRKYTHRCKLLSSSGTVCRS